jgi:hypothetical protein
MKTKLITLITLLLFTFSVNSQEKKSASVQNIETSENTIYKLFPTLNVWTYIKLDTRNGKMWQVHFSINSDQLEGQIELNSFSLVNENDESKGRFTLYKTENIYNLILLDQKDGRVWQVQWNNKSELRGINRIY